MSSPIPTRSVDSDSNQSDTRARSVSSSSTSHTPLFVVQQSTSRRSQTPKARRKSVSNRSTPYVVAASPHSNRTAASTITFDDDRVQFDENGGPPSSNTNFDRSSTNAIANPLSARPDQPPHPRHAFERSSEEVREMNDFEMSKLHQIHPFQVTEENADLSGRMSTIKVMNHFTSVGVNQYKCKLCTEVRSHH